VETQHTETHPRMLRVWRLRWTGGSKEDMMQISGNKPSGNTKIEVPEISREDSLMFEANLRTQLANVWTRLNCRLWSSGLCRRELLKWLSTWQNEGDTDHRNVCNHPQNCTTSEPPANHSRLRHSDTQNSSSELVSDTVRWRTYATALINIPCS
jgi:hypothetical protein